MPLIVALGYALALFAFASWANRADNQRIKRLLRPSAYALAIGVYCTSWTYYGAVGSAVTDGWSYPAIYLGPILVFMFAMPFLRRMVDAVKADGANSISDFIGGRFGSSGGVAALVTILALCGTIPYIALQLRSLSTTFALLSGQEASALTMAVAAVGLAIFAMVYGTRHYDAASRNDAVLFAVGFESFLKLGALLAAAGFAFLLISGLDSAALTSASTSFAANFAPETISADFFIITLLSMSAILTLPRQFYVTVIEAQSSEDVARARWPFVIYLLLMLAVVPPISIAGLALLPEGTRPDVFVLQLPLDQGMGALALLVFLGGFSAATAMVLVETIALATMMSNDLIAPRLLANPHVTRERNLGETLLFVRRGSIAFIMLAAFGWAAGIRDNQGLASIGLIAFAAMAQFAPVLIMAVLGGDRDSVAAKASLTVGLIVWIYTLALPQIMPLAWLDSLSGTVFNPNGLLGIDGLSPLSHGTMWSLGANLLTFTIVTMRRVQPSAFPALLRDSKMGGGTIGSLAELEALVARFIGVETAAEQFGDRDRTAQVDRQSARLAERLIAGVVGLPSARALVGSALFGSNLTHEEVARLLDDTGQSLRFSKGILAATLEHIDPGVSVVDRDLNIVAWNSRYLELFDYPPGLVRVGVPVAELIRFNALKGEWGKGEIGPEEVEAHVERRLGHMKRGQAHSFERVRPDGRVLKTVGGPMPSGGYVMCFTDVTAEAEAVAALQKARAELESRVDERTSELQDANRALAAADAEKTRFLAAASHDLLQPIHAARLFAAALARDVAALDEAARPKMLVEKLDRSIESADALLRALLDISRLDAGGVTAKPEAVGLRTMLLEMLDTFAPLAREKGLSLRVGPGDATVETDPGLLRSIVQNFLSNAIRYTDKGGIVIGVRRRGSAARVDVIDTGAGIPEEKRQLIFREFERLSTAQEGGIGLGLAIVDRTARLLDARISVRSREGRGSRFSVALPVAAIALDTKPIRPMAVGPMPNNMDLLIVDDDPANCEALAAYLTGLGHHVRVASSAADAMLNGGAFDVALVDYDLGEGPNGLDVIQDLRGYAPFARYALVTATRPADYAARARAMNVIALRKPVAPADLLHFLRGIDMGEAAE